MKETNELEEKVLRNEAQIPEEDQQAYAIATARERISSIRNVLDIYHEALTRHENAAMSESPNAGYIKGTFGHLNKMAQSLAALHEGHGDLQVRKRTHNKMFPPREEPAPVTTEKPKRKKRTREDLEARIQEQLTREKEQSREGYLADRTPLLAALKAATTDDEKSLIKKELNDCEEQYTQTYRKFQNGTRERELRIQAANRSRPSQVPRRSTPDRTAERPRPNPRPTPTPRSRNPRGPSAIDLALRELDQEDRRKRQQEREFQDLTVQVRSHPFKTYDVKDERQYQTSGVPNRRAKKII